MFSFRFISRGLSQLPKVLTQQVNRFHCFTSPALHNKSFSCNQLIKPVLEQSKSSGVLAFTACQSCAGVQQVRNHTRVYYKPRAWKRINKFGIEKLLSTRNGRTVLWRKFLKGKYNYASYERFLPPSFYGRILPKHQKHLHKPFVSKKRYAP